MAEAERVLELDDLRADRGELELVDENTGEIVDVVRPRSPLCPTLLDTEQAPPSASASADDNRSRKTGYVS
jgi:hypothetical protein